MDRDLRRLLLIVAGLVVVLFTGRALIGAMYDDEEMVRQAHSLRVKLRSGGEAEGRPRREDLAALSALRDELAAKLEALAPAVRYVQPPEFSVAAGGSPDLEYVEILRREQQKLVKDAAYKGRSVPSNLGMPDLNPTGLEDVLRTLRSLHIVHIVVSAALDAGVDSVDEIRIPGAVRRGQESTGYLRLHKVEFSLRGSPHAVRDALAAVAGGTPWLALDDLRLESQDADGTRVLARFSASAVTVDESQPSAEGASK
jgi:hypothetical protein